MAELPRYSDYVPDVDAKKDIYYNFFVKPASTWTCSSDQRLDAISAMQKIIDERDDDENREGRLDRFDGLNKLRGAWLLTMIYICAIFFPVIAFCCISMKCRTHWSAYFFLGIMFAIELLSITIVIQSSRAKNEFHDASDRLMGLETAVRGCMDSYSVLDRTQIREELTVPADDAEKAAIVLQTNGILILHKIFIGACITIHMMRNQKKQPAA